jgi:hypothetical protein
VGEKRSDIYALIEHSTGRVRIDCKNNPAFWLEFQLPFKVPKRPIIYKAYVYDVDGKESIYNKPASFFTWEWLDGQVGGKFDLAPFDDDFEPTLYYLFDKEWKEKKLLANKKYPQYGGVVLIIPSDAI